MYVLPVDFSRVASTLVLSDEVYHRPVLSGEQIVNPRQKRVRVDGASLPRLLPDVQFSGGERVLVIYIRCDVLTEATVHRQFRGDIMARFEAMSIFKHSELVSDRNR
jgi:hypothetical protein